MEFVEPPLEEQRGDEEPKDKKTEELVGELEQQVDKAYTAVETNTKQGWNMLSGFISNLQEKLPDYIENSKDYTKSFDLNKTKESLTKSLEGLNLKDSNIDIGQFKQKSGELLGSVNENTSKVLDDLDNDLEKLENITFDYASQFTSFLKEKTNGLNLNLNLQNLGFVGNLEDTVQEDKKSELLFSLPKGVSGTRVESQLHDLQSNKELYLKGLENNDFEDLKLNDDQLKEKDELLSNESLQLTKIFKELVDEEKKIDADTFWKLYFGNKEKIILEEKKRKELLEKSKGASNDEDEEFNWDDDDDDEDEEKNDEAETETEAEAESEAELKTEAK